MGISLHNKEFSIPSPESATLFQALLTALTGTYAQFGAEIDLQGHTTAFVHLYWTKGDETSIQVKVEHSLVSGGTLAQEVQGVSTDTATGQDTLKIRDYTFSTASDNIIIPLRKQGRYCKVYINATGGTPTGTFGAGLYEVRE